MMLNQGGQICSAALLSLSFAIIHCLNLVVVITLVLWYCESFLPFLYREERQVIAVTAFAFWWWSSLLSLDHMPSSLFLGVMVLLLLLLVANSASSSRPFPYFYDEDHLVFANQDSRELNRWSLFVYVVYFHSFLRTLATIYRAGTCILSIRMMKTRAHKWSIVPVTDSRLLHIATCS